MDDEVSEDEAMVIPINRAMTDGDPSTWPQEDKYDRPDDSLYREKLAVMWLKHMGAYEEGMCVLHPGCIVCVLANDDRNGLYLG